MVIRRLLLSTALILTGCTVGPDFILPKTSMIHSWFDHGTAKARQVTDEAPVDITWWRQLNDPMLDQLVARISSSNLDVLTASARLDESRAQLGIVSADLYPQINGDASYTRQKLSQKGVISLVGGGPSGGSSAASSPAGGFPSSGDIPPFNVYQYGFDASWELDLWGRVRRSREAASATMHGMEEARCATQLSVIAELVSDYVQLRGTQALIQSIEENLATARQMAQLTSDRAKGGLGNQLDVANANAQAATISATLPQMQQQQDNLKNAIALLLGLPPGGISAELSTTMPVPPLPVSVPIGLPSELVHRRPDIRQAEDQLHAATAQIGVAKADFFPQVTLTGNGMLQALELKNLNTWAARSYSFGPSISLPIFEGGRLKSTLHLRKAEQKEAALQYRKTVLTAFHEVDNALTAFRNEQQRRHAFSMAVTENRKALALATDRYKQGLSTFIDVLTAQQNLLQSEQQYISSTQTTSFNMVQLYKALGGGWENVFPRADQ